MKVDFLGASEKVLLRALRVPVSAKHAQPKLEERRLGCAGAALKSGPPQPGGVGGFALNPNIAGVRYIGK
jgi:hypothetical protein